MFRACLSRESLWGLGRLSRRVSTEAGLGGDDIARGRAPRTRKQRAGDQRPDCGRQAWSVACRPLKLPESNLSGINKNEGSE